MRESGHPTAETSAHVQGHNGDSTFRRYYVEEVNNNLRVLEGCLRRLEATHDPKTVEEIALAAERLRDLAMVHGYEAVEAIALKVERVLQPWRFQQGALPAHLRQKLQEAVKALHKVIALTDDSEERAVVEHTETAIPPPRKMPLLPTLPPPLSVEPEEHPEPKTEELKKTEEAEPEDEELAFDIKEGELLVSLMSGEDEESSLSDKDFPEESEENQSKGHRGEMLTKTTPSRDERPTGAEDDRIAHQQVRRKWVPRRRFRFDF